MGIGFVERERTDSGAVSFSGLSEWCCQGGFAEGFPAALGAMSVWGQQLWGEQRSSGCAARLVVV